MRKFIAFVIVMLPITAVLSMVAGFWYAASMRRAPTVASAPIVLPLPTRVAPIPAPAATDQTDSDIYGALMLVQVTQCTSAVEQLGRQGRMSDVLGVRACVSGLRAMQAPAGRETLHADALRLADELSAFADDYEAGVRDTDAAQLAKAGARIKPLGEMFKAVIRQLP